MTNRITTGETFTQLCKAATGSTPFCGVFGLPKTGRAVYYSALYEATKRPIIVVAPTDADAARITQDIDFFCHRRVCTFLGRDLVLQHIEGQSRSYEYNRIAALGKIVGGRAAIVVTTAEALCCPLPPRSAFCGATVTLSVGGNYPTGDLTHRLILSGYIRRDNVEAPGQFALRGGILDVFTPDLEKPIRCELWGDVIEHMATFDVISQRREDKIKKAHISPAREVIFESTDAALLKFEEFLKRQKPKSHEQIKDAFADELSQLKDGIMPASMDKFYPVCYESYGSLPLYLEDPLILVDDYNAALSAAKEASKRASQQISSLSSAKELSPDMHYYSESDAFIAVLRKGFCVFESFERKIDKLKISHTFNILCHQLPVWTGGTATLFEELAAYLENGCQIRLLAGTKRAAAALEKEIVAAGYTATTDKDINTTLPIVVIEAGNLSGGADFPNEKYCIISGRRADHTKKKVHKARSLASLSDITKGDYMVHQNHGVGQYDGIESMEMQGVTKDYIKLCYAKGDTLYIPVTQLDLLSRYSGGEEGSVHLSKLGTAEWGKAKSRATAATAEMAKELISLYSQRLQTPGFAFFDDDDWQSDFEQRFAYDETDDQLRAVREIKADMQSAHTMDRLLCGDVGVGKTEVALRAAFKCIISGKQVALLCPTTILAMQHHNTVCERMEAFSIKVALLSRFRSAAQNKVTLKDIKTGTVDFVIGTHKLIQKGVTFKNLGLLIVDEEQRFGVSHKERLKEMFVGVDVLTLSATPIPRTLNMAMSGIRDLSTIDEPPGERQPIDTYVTEYDPQQITAAIEREIARGGQVYYIHNRIDTIERCVDKLAEMLPGATIAAAHGRMDEKDLSAVWGELLSGELDILVSTTIIETGVDVRNCNTLIIEDADRLGLAQLYQMRGRVGRSGRKAYAYFTFRRGKVVSEVAEKRLSAIREFTSFGSGFRIAMRDLQIRGAGNLLGKSQSGHLQSVGYEMYMKLLNTAIATIKGIAPKSDKSECLIDISVDAFIPKKYIPDTPSRIEAYKKIAAIETEDDAAEILSELEDRYGTVPKSAGSLCDISLLRVLAARLGFYEIMQRDDTIICYSDRYDTAALRPIFSEFSGCCGYSAGTKPYLWLRPKKDLSALALLKLALAQIEAVVYNKT